MILIGQYDSSFVRRVGIALRLYGHAFEHRPWSVFGDEARLAPVSPMGRVPVLILDDGSALLDSAAILDHLDEGAGAAALIARSGPARRDALQVIALATGLAELGVRLFYVRHLAQGPDLAARLERQIARTFAALEECRAARPGPWWDGDRLGHADIALACALRHVTEALPDLWRPDAHPSLVAHAGAAEALPVFAEISQPFVPPA